MDDVHSTLTQKEIAQSLVKSAVSKHQTRYESVFLKAVSIHFSVMSSTRQIDFRSKIE